MTNDYGNLERHKVLLSAMKDIDKICREYGLKYYMYAGTVLGSLNHGGFIPWDDDADIVMFKEDYDKFVKIVQEEYSDIYFMQTFDTDDEWFSKMSKLRLLGTRDFTNGDKEIRKEMFIDINPLYNVPDNMMIRTIQRKSIEFINMLFAVMSGEIKCSSIKTRLTLLPLSKLGRNFWGGIMDFCLNKLGNKDSKYVCLMCNTLTKSRWTGRSGYDSDVMVKEGYLNPTYLPFEDTEFMVSSMWHSDMVHLYGEGYREPYPEEKRKSKHDIVGYEISEEVRERVGL